MTSQLENGVHLNGYLSVDEDEDVCLFDDLSNEWNSTKIADKIYKGLLPYMDIEIEEIEEIEEIDEEDGIWDNEIMDSTIENVSIRMYVSDKEISLERAQHLQILSSIGALTICESWYGYSEWTILGYNVDEFKLVGNGGEHDLTEILKGYEGKYIHIICEIVK